MMLNQLKILIFSLLIVGLAQCFIITMSKYERKCFYTQIISESTLELKFGFPQLSYQNCKVQFSIESQREQEKIQQQKYKILYDNIHFCHDRRSRDLIVFKYAHQQTGLHAYRICLNNLDDYKSNKTYVQLIISQKQNLSTKPQIVNDALIYSSQLFDFQQTIQSIKTKLSWANTYIKVAQTTGDQLDLVIKQQQDFNKKLIYIQICFLIFYGIFWILIAKIIIQRISHK